MKFFLSFVSLMVVLVIQDSMAVDDFLKPLDELKRLIQLVRDRIHTDDGHAIGAAGSLDTVVESRGHVFDEGENAGIGGVNNGNKGDGAGGSSGHIYGLNGYGGGNEGGKNSKFQGN